MKVIRSGQPLFSRPCDDCGLSCTTLYQDGNTVPEPARCEECYIAHRSGHDRRSYASVDDVAAADQAKELELEPDTEDQSRQNAASAPAPAGLGHLPDRELVDSYNRLRASRDLVPWEHLDHQTQERARAHAQGSLNSLTGTLRTTVDDALERLAMVGGFGAANTDEKNEASSQGPEPAEAQGPKGRAR